MRGTPARLSARAAHHSCGRTTVGDVATPVVYPLVASEAAMCPIPWRPNAHWKSWYSQPLPRLRMPS